ncbi:MAG: response regulator [bacterium]
MAEAERYRYGNLKLANKFILINFVAFVPLLLVCGLLFFAGRSNKDLSSEAIKKNDQEKIAGVANNINEKIISQLNNHLESVAILSAHNQIKHLIYQVRLNGRLNKKKKCIELSDLSSHYQPLLSYFKEVARRSPQIKSIDLYWRNGYLLCGAEGTGGDQYVGDRDWFQGTLDPNFNSLKAFYVSTAAEINYATPIDIEGKRLAVMLVRMDAASITNYIFNTAAKDGNTYSALVDASLEGGNPFIVFSSCSAPADVFNALVSSFKQHLSEKEDDTFHFYHKEEKWWAYYKQMPLDQKQWYIITTRASKELKQSDSFIPSKLLQAILIFSALFFSIFATRIFYTKIFNPLCLLERKICSVIESGMNKGLYDISIDCPIELFSLMHNFQLMMSKIQKEFNKMRNLLESKEVVEKEKNLFKAVLDKSKNGIRVLDKERTVVLANPKIAYFTGIPVKEQIGKKYFIESLLPDCNGKDCKFNGIFDGGPEIIQQEFKHNGLKDPLWLRLTVTRLTDDEKNIIGVFQSFKDITNEVRAKNRDSQKDRSIIVPDETNKHLEKEKNQLLALMRHELLSPINGILGLIRFMEETRLNEKQRDYMNKIKRAVFSFLILIHNILDYQKIEKKSLEIEKMRFNLIVLLEEVFSQFNEEAEEKRLKLSYDSTPQIPPHLLGDPERLRQILNNVLKNVIQLSGKGTILVEIKNDPESEQINNQVPLRFSISYTGDSMLRYKLNHYYSAFNYDNGSDFAISLTKRLIYLLGGSIHIEDKTNKEKVLCFTLPFGIPIAALEKAQKKVKTIKDLKELRALILNPDAKEREKTRKLLASYKISVSEAIDEKEAAIKIERAMRIHLPFHFLLAYNYSMPEKNLFEIAKNIKKNLELSDLAIVAFPFYSLPGDFARCRKSSVKAYLSRPVSEAELLSTLVKIVEKEDNDLITKYSILGNQNTRNVLLVEDNLINQKSVKTKLEIQGCKVSCADNGKVALQLLESNKYDLILLDMQMPVLNGYETARKIREKEAQASNKVHLPIIAMTARPIKESSEMFLNVGIDDYITKPVKEDQLEDILSRWEISESGPFIWDARKALSQAENDIEMLYQLVHMFIQEFPDLIEKVRFAIEKKDNQEIEDLAQYITGSAGNLSAQALIELITGIEKYNKESNFDETSKIVDNLVIEFEKFKNQTKGFMRYMIDC